MKLEIFLSTLDESGWTTGEIVTELSIIGPTPLGWALIGLIGISVVIGFFLFKKKLKF